MWIMTTNGMLSCVRHKDSPDVIIVRARKRRHLVQHFPRKKEDIFYLGNADYNWRLYVRNNDLKEMIMSYIDMNLKYPNFKKAVEELKPDDSNYIEALHETWGVFIRHLKD